MCKSKIMRTKYILFTTTFCFLLSTFNSVAQQDTLKGQKGDWGLSVNISGIINDIKLENAKDGIGNYIIFGRKYIKDDVAIRVGFNAAFINDKWNSEDSISIGSGNTAFRQIDSTTSRFDFSILIGYEKHFGHTKRLDPYFAGEIAIGRRGNTDIKKNTNIKDLTGTDKTQYLVTYDGGYMFGIGVTAGFNYFIAPKLSLGVEFGYYYNFINSGGDYTQSVVNTSSSGAQSSTFTRGVIEESINALNVGSSSAITLSYFF